MTQRIALLEKAAQRELISQVLEQNYRTLTQTYENISNLREEYEGLGELPEIPLEQKRKIEEDLKLRIKQPYEFPKAFTFRAALLLLFVFLLPWPADTIFILVFLGVFLSMFFEAIALYREARIVKWTLKNADLLGFLSAVGVWLSFFNFIDVYLLSPSLDVLEIYKFGIVRAIIIIVCIIIGRFHWRLIKKTTLKPIAKLQEEDSHLNEDFQSKKEESLLSSSDEFRSIPKQVVASNRKILLRSIFVFLLLAVVIAVVGLIYKDLILYGSLTKPDQPNAIVEFLVGTPTPTPDVKSSRSLSGTFADILLVIDISGSMEGEKLTQMQLALKTFFDNLLPQDQIGLITFNDKIDIVVPLTDVATIKQDFYLAVDNLEAGGDTALYDAVDSSLANFQNVESTGNERKKIVIIATDGQDTASFKYLDELITEITGLTNVTVIPIAYGNDADTNSLNSMAKASSTFMYKVDPSDQYWVFDIIRRYL